MVVIRALADLPEHLCRVDEVRDRRYSPALLSQAGMCQIIYIIWGVSP